MDGESDRGAHDTDIPEVAATDYPTTDPVSVMTSDIFTPERMRLLRIGVCYDGVALLPKDWKRRNRLSSMLEQAEQAQNRLNMMTTIYSLQPSFSMADIVIMIKKMFPSKAVFYGS